jgi:hypothetical protein
MRQVRIQIQKTKSTESKLLDLRTPSGVELPY